MAPAARDRPPYTCPSRLNARKDAFHASGPNARGVGGDRSTTDFSESGSAVSAAAVLRRFCERAASGGILDTAFFSGVASGGARGAWDRRAREMKRCEKSGQSQSPNN